MAIYLDEQLDDEPLFGLIARYLEKSSSTNTRTVLEGLFGEIRQASVLGCRLEQVARETEACWGLSASEIAEKMTCFPYVAALSSPEKARKILDTMIGISLIGEHRERSFRLRGHALRFCMSCLREDQQSGDPMHWRRVHLLPGVILCPWHGERLWVSTPLRKSRTHGYFSPEGAIQSGAQSISLRLTDYQQRCCLELSRVSADMLYGRLTVSSSRFALELCEGLRARSRYFAGRRQEDCIDRILSDCFGDEYLESYALGPTKKSFLSAMRSKYPPPSRIVVALTLMRLVEAQIVALDDARFHDLYDHQPSDSVRSRQGTPLPILHCPSGLALHGPGHVVDKVIRRFGRLRAVCDCGLCFSLAETLTGANDMTVTVWGPDYVNEVRRLKSLGTGGTTIGHILGIPERTVFNMLQR
jgi:hypothetical protein